MFTWSIYCAWLSTPLALAQANGNVRVINNVRAATHSIWINPKFVDAEIDGSFRVLDLVDTYGFLSVVPRTRGFGGTHYGEFRSNWRLVRARGGFTFGPAHEHVGRSRAKDFEKLGVAGRFNGPRRTSFTYEAYVWSSTPKRNNLGISYAIPIAAGWRITGFWDYLVRLPGQPKVLKATLRHDLPHRFEIMAEYFHSELAPRRERDKISAGFGFRFR